jgi:hypothetical protein
LRFFINFESSRKIPICFTDFEIFENFEIPEKVWDFESSRKIPICLSDFEIFENFEIAEKVWDSGNFGVSRSRDRDRIGGRGLREHVFHGKLKL